MNGRPALLDTSVLIARESGRSLDVDALPQSTAELRVRLHELGRRAKVNDLWIAAIALANDMPVVTQDDDFDVIEEAGGPVVIRV